MTVEMSSGVCAANLLEPMQFALGPTMAGAAGVRGGDWRVRGDGGVLRGRLCAGELDCGEGAYRWC